MSTKMTKLVLVIGAMVMAGGAMAQSSATATASASATVIRPITITKTADLSFGTIVPSSSAGTVVVSTLAARSATGGTTIMTTQTGTVTAAAFTVGGEGAATYSVTLPSSAELSNGAETMTVQAFTSDPGTTAGAGLLSSTAGSEGTQALKVGATLAVDAAQVAGSYTGTFDVTVAYN